MQFDAGAAGIDDFKVYMYLQQFLTTAVFKGIM
jgi:hypothetical protein